MKTAVNSIEDIRAVLAAHKEEVVRRYRVTEIGIFGSFVRGEQRRGSDVDILVSFASMPDVYAYLDLEDYLKGVLHRRVDVVRKEAIRPELKRRILRETVYV